MSSDTLMLQESRRQFAETITHAVRQMGKVIEAEQKELCRRFPALADRSASIMSDPDAFKNLADSAPYCQAVEAYVAGRLEVNLMVKVLELLRQIAPLEFSAH